MPAAIRIPITNALAVGEYAATILVGTRKQALNVLLDTGSSALALDGAKCRPAADDETTELAQMVGYADGSAWTGAVVRTAVAIGEGTGAITLPKANAAIAYQTEGAPFGGADGILGLAYQPLDEAFATPTDAWAGQYPAAQVTQGRRTTLAPYLSQLASAGIAADVFALSTRRSLVRQGADAAADPLNQGWLILGGGAECTDLYRGPFQSVKVAADKWYNVVLRAVVVGVSAIPVAARRPTGAPSNPGIDSGDPYLSFGPALLAEVLAKFSAAQQAQLKASMAGQTVAAADLDLAAWPSLTFVLQGETGDARLVVAPTDHWQVDSPQAGLATAALSQGVDGVSVLGLPLLSGYFTIFDRAADGGRGAIRFAASVR